MDSEEEEAIYCVCRSTDVSRFMIGCDHCEEWYHGDCINVTARESKYIKKFFCNECRDKNPSLSIVYKSKYADKIQEIAKQKEREEREKKIVKENKEKLGEKEEEKPKPKLSSIPKIPKNKDSSKKSDPSSSSKSRDDKAEVKVKSEHKEKTKDVKVKDEPKERVKDIKSKDEHKEKIKEVKVKDEPKEKTKEIKAKDESRDKVREVKEESKEKVKEERKKEEKKHKHKHKDDKEEKKHKHKHKHKEKEKEKDQEKDIDKEKKKKHKHKSKPLDEIEEDELAWLQSENTNMDGVKRIPKEFKEPAEKEKVKEEKDLEKEKQKEKDKEKEKEKKKQKEKDEKEKERKKELELEKKKQQEKEKAKEEKKKEAEQKKKADLIDNRERSISTDSHSKSQDSHSEMTRSPAAALPKRPPLTERQQIKEIENVDEWQPSSSKPSKAPSKRKDRNESKDGHARPKKRRRDWRDLGESSSEDDAGPEMDLKPRQCYGPQCTKCARVGSKYCSEQCGLSLASHRIYQTLPDRIREWNMKPCKAEENNRKELERIRAELQEVRQRLEERNREVDMLEAIIAKGRSLSVIEKDDSDDDEDEVRMGAIDCITCGKEVPVRTAIKHMESCFNKLESQTSFGSMYKTKIEGYQMFCDYYNQQSGTYCKRLRVICPEHTIDEKISDTAVCGFPLTKDVFSITGEFCRVAKKECNAHYCWEKLRRAELDMDRVRQWLKIDDLFEQERQEKEIISRRAGVLGLLLHSTFNHVVLDERMKAQRMQQQQQQMAMLQQQQELRRQQVTGQNKTLNAKKV